jgi:uncharacterized protein YkwD
MKPIRASLLSSLCILTLLSACGNHDDPAATLSGGAVDGNELNIPGEEGPDGQFNKQMIKAGLREANQVRRHRHLPRLEMDLNLVIAAQQKARQMCANGGDDYHHHAATGSSDGISALPDMGGGYGIQHHGPHFPQPPQYTQAPYGYAENIARGMRGPRAVEQVFIRWQKVSIYSQNLNNPDFRRQGIGYCEGNWVQLLAN